MNRTKYKNPVLRGFHPDPSVCRVGKDYYLVTSSFEYFPGIPIFHSRDLVNWKQIGNCCSQSEHYPLEQVKDSGGIWAPSIRYAKGRFYVTATLEKYGNFIISSTYPAGEWSDPVWVNVGGIDPSLYFEGERAYYCTNATLHPGTEEITLSEINPDTGELLTPLQTIWTGIGGGFMEAPHIYYVDGWYYLMTAEGGTNFNHMITMARSRSVWGPFESCPNNPILTNAHDTSKQVQCSGHGDLIEDHNGNWWIFHLATRLSRRTMTHLGRETFLTPVSWKEGWLKVENRRKAMLEEEGPLWVQQVTETEWSADFTRKEWEPEWIFLRNPQKEKYSRENGKLHIYPSLISLEEQKNPSFAAVRQPDFDCVIEAEYEFEPKMIGDEAGIAVLLSGDFHYRFGKVKTAEGDFLILERRVEDICHRDCQIPLQNDPLKLRILADKEKYYFEYVSEEGMYQTAAAASTRFLSCELAGKCFTGTVIGLYTLCVHETTAVMEISDFRYRTTSGERNS